MNLKFNIQYQTVFGQELVLNIVGGKKNGNDATTEFRMHTKDGLQWEYDWSGPKTRKNIEYFYSVKKGETTERREWAVVPHKLELNSLRMANYTIMDRWIDIPEDSYMYSSAITECIVRKQLGRVKEQSYARTVRLKVRAPQLNFSQRLTVVGAGDILGKWNLADARPMTEHNINEWIVDLDVTHITSGLSHRPVVLEFKFVVVDEDNIETEWEEGYNRKIELPDMQDGDILVYELADAHFPFPPVKCAGTLIPVFSLRSKTSFGVGDFGDLKKMIDWVATTRQRLLQILPINDTTITHTWTDSYPYSCISIFALHPQYADLNGLPKLKDVKLRKEMEALRKELNALPQIDYERVNEAKNRYLRALFAQEGAKVLATKAFRDFFNEAEQWLVPYAQYCYLRDRNGSADFSTWPDHNTWDEKERKELAAPEGGQYDNVAYYYYVQYVLSRQMKDAHDYAREKGVILKGDIPIGVNRYGCDVWAEPRYFNLNGQAGAPPDDFSADGQNWGFPTYNWDEMIADDCRWWVRRFQNMAHYFDAYRIDHVLGFFRIWEIPMPATSGLEGQFAPALGLSREEIDSYGIYGHDDLFLVDHKRSDRWHPRIAVQFQVPYQKLNEDEKYNFNRLYNDYFYRRNNQFWYREAMKKLPRLVNATRMLVCAEDLGMVPDCVEWVMNELRILSLELQSMPKDPTTRFGHLSKNPYRSVCTISSHDMPTLRQWWDEDMERTQDYYATMLHRGNEAPHPLPGWLARDIISRHLTCPSMLCVIALQDWFAIDEKLRLPDGNAERINIPANPKHYWRYRMHVNIEDLMDNRDFKANIVELITSAGR